MVSALGVISLFGYILGGVCWTFTLWSFAEHRLHHFSGLFWAGVGLLTLAVVLQLLRDHLADDVPNVIKEGRDASKPVDARKAKRQAQKAVGYPLVIWLLTVAGPWLQFELHRDPIRMVPTMTFVSGVWLSLAAAGILFARTKFESTFTALFVSMVGIPIGIFGFSIPQNHFNDHLTTVSVIVGSNFSPTADTPREVKIEAHEPVQETAPSMGKRQLELLGDMAGAKRIDVDEKLRSGAWKRDSNGALLEVKADGTTQPILTGQAAMDEMNKEMTKAAKAAAVEAEAVQVRNAEERRKLKEGGRLFNFGPASRAP